MQQTAIHQLPQGGPTLEVVDAIFVWFTRGDGNGCVVKISYMRLLELTGFECFDKGRIRCQQPTAVNLKHELNA